MKIAFLCGCLEPGRDGVGDYTRRLAAELILQGHQATIIAINDPHFAQVVLDNNEEKRSFRSASEMECALNTLQGATWQDSNETHIEVLRLPRAMPWLERVRIAQRYVEEFAPNWMSLQYVPYSFHPKGIPFSIPGRLCEIGNGRDWHIMFHELWIGITRSSTLKHKLTGFVQRIVTRRLIARLNPKVVTTSMNLYVEMLRRIGTPSTLLPIFGCIDVSKSEDKWLHSQLMFHDIDTLTQRNDWLIAGIFGALYFSFDVTKAVEQLRSEARLQNKQLLILAAGANSDGRTWAKKLSDETSGTKVVHLGQLTPTQVSSFLSCLDIGLPAAPWQMLGKSSVAATMCDHGIELRAFGDIPLPEYEDVLGIKGSFQDLFSTAPLTARKLIDLLTQSSITVRNSGF